MTTPLGPDDSQGPSTFRSRYQQVKQDPRVQQAAADVSAAHPPGEAFRGIRTTAGAVRAGYQMGKDPANADLFGSQPASQSPGGWASQGDVSNGNGGDDELATKGDVNEAASGLHDRLGNIESGMQNAGGVMDTNAAFGQGMGTAPAPQAAGTQQPGVTPPTMIDFAKQRADMANMALSNHASFQNARASFNQRAATQAAATPGTVQPTGTGNGMSSAMQENSMSGALGGSPMRPNSGIGQSESSFNSTRFMGGQS